MTGPVHRRGAFAEFIGPAHLMETPTDGEIRGRINAAEWRNDSTREFVERQHRLGLIRTRFELECLCSSPSGDYNLNSFAVRYGVKIVWRSPGSWK
jgi:hypothetical protein